jgi:hypothetical protein
VCQRTRPTILRVSAQIYYLWRAKYLITRRITILNAISRRLVLLYRATDLTKETAEPEFFRGHKFTLMCQDRLEWSDLQFSSILCTAGH